MTLHSCVELLSWKSVPLLGSRCYASAFLRSRERWTERVNIVDTFVVQEWPGFVECVDIPPWNKDARRSERFFDTGAAPPPPNAGNGPKLFHVMCNNGVCYRSQALRCERCNNFVRP